MTSKYYAGIKELMNALLKQRITDKAVSRDFELRPCNFNNNTKTHNSKRVFNGDCSTKYAPCEVKYLACKNKSIGDVNKNLKDRINQNINDAIKLKNRN